MKNVFFAIIFAIITLFSSGFVFAGEAKNTHDVLFTTSSDILLTMCYPKGKKPPMHKFTGVSSSGNISLKFVCLAREPKKGKLGHAVRYYITKDRSVESVLDAFLGSVTVFKDKKLSYSAVDSEEYPEHYNNLSFKEVTFSSGKKMSFHYKKKEIASGQIAEVYFITLYINKRVYRHHAIARLQTSIENTDIWIMFSNERYSKYKKIKQGQNDPVNKAVDSILSGFNFQ